MSKRFFFKQSSPTQKSLAQTLARRGWRPSSLSWLANVSDKHLTLPAVLSETLEYKHLFTPFCQKYGLNNMMPTTYYIDDKNWPDVMNRINWSQDSRYILKPSMLNNGQHIALFSQAAELEKHFLSGQRMGGIHVLQHYIDPPHLVKGPERGHKYSIRQLMVVSSHADMALYPEGYLNIALKPYDRQTKDLSVHLTNEHLSGERINVVQRLTAGMAIYEPMRSQVRQACQRLAAAIRAQFHSILDEHTMQFSCFGVDFMVDHHEKLWLLEMNHGPCFPLSDVHPLYKDLYQPFWEAVVDRFILSESSNMIDLT